MKILLVNPRGDFVKRNVSLKTFIEKNPRFFRLWIMPNLALLVLASLFRKHFVDIDVEYIDEQTQSIDFSKTYDIVAISSFTQQSERAKHLSRSFQKNGCLTIIGGIHPTVLPSDCRNFFDVVFIGEVEEIFGEFADDYKNMRTKKQYQSRGPVDMRHSPIPDYTLLHGFFDNPALEGIRMVPLQTTRGCPFDCYFCAASRVYGKRYRSKSVGQITGELQAIINEGFHRHVVVFNDDNMFANRRYAEGLVDALSDFKLRWATQTDIRIAEDERFLKKLYSSGCQQLLIGLESLNADMLKNLDRANAKLNLLSKYKEYVIRIQEHGISVIGAFIIGLRNDSEESIKRIRDFVLATNIFPQFTVLTPFPGTRLNEEFREQGLLLDNVDFSDYTIHDTVFRYNNNTVDELEKAITWLHRETFNATANDNRARYLKNIYKKLLEVRQ